MSINPTNTALIILDGQNDFLSQGGVLYPVILNTINGPQLLQRLNRAIAAAREKGMLVVNTSVAFSEGYKEAGEAPYGIFASVGATGGFVKNTWGVETAEGLNIQEDDIFIEKAGMNAFINPEFEVTLQKHNINTMILAGLLSNACVECTMRRGILFPQIGAGIANCSSRR